MRAECSFTSYIIRGLVGAFTMLTQLTLRFAESDINELSLAQEWLKSSCIFSDKPLVLPPWGLN